MRAAVLTDASGPATGLRILDVPEPREVCAILGAPDEPVTIAVRAAGVAFPELLQSRGRYQYQPSLPFVPGSEVAGVVLDAPAGSDLRPGDRVFAACGIGGFAERVVAPAALTFALPEELDFAQGAALFSNYGTAHFALVTRGRATAGESVLVHGAAGGVGTAVLQVAAALGLRTTAVVSSDEKAAIARAAGAHAVVRGRPGWPDEVLAGSGPVDLVLDTVGDRALDSLGVLRREGRLVVVGFASGTIPRIPVDRLLATGIAVVGAGYGADAFGRPEISRAIHRALDPMIRSGAVRPPIGARFALEDAAAALDHLDSRRAVGKVVIEVPADGRPVRPPGRRQPAPTVPAPGTGSGGVAPDAVMPFRNMSQKL